MATNVGDMYVNLKLEIKDLKKGLNQAKKELRSMSKDTGRSADGVDKLNKSMRTNVKVSKDMARQSKSHNSAMITKIRQYETMAVAIGGIRRAYKGIIHQGVTLNKMYEDQSLGIAALISAKTSMVDANGVELTSYEQFTAAQQMTLNTMDEIKKAALSTPASFQEMVGFYQQTIGHAIDENKSFGSSMKEINKNVIDFTKRMSSLGAAAGMEMPKINEEIRSLMSGNASTDSLLAMLLFGSPSAANKVVREAKTKMNGLSDAILGALEPFKNLEDVDTYTKSFAKMKAAMDDVRREGTKPLFDDLKRLYDLMSGENVANKDWMVKMFQDSYIKIKQLVLTVYQGFDDIVEISKTVYNMFNTGHDALFTWLGVLDHIRKALVIIQMAALGAVKVVNSLLFTVNKFRSARMDLNESLGLDPDKLKQGEKNQLAYYRAKKKTAELSEFETGRMSELVGIEKEYTKWAENRKDIYESNDRLIKDRIKIEEMGNELAKQTTQLASDNYKMEHRSLAVQYEKLDAIRKAKTMEEAVAAMENAKANANNDTGRLAEITHEYNKQVDAIRSFNKVAEVRAKASDKILETEKKINKAKAKGRSAAKKGGGASAEMKRAAAEREKLARQEDAKFKKRMKEYQDEIDNFSDSLSGAFTDAFDSLIEGDFGGALKGLFDDILDTMVSPFTEALGDYFGKMFSEMILGKKAYAAVAKAADAEEATSKGLLAVLNAGTNGDGYTAIARMAAMAAVVASLGVAIGGSFGGGNGVSEQDLKAAEGITGVQSESANNAIGIIARNSTTGLKYSEEMAMSLRQLVSLTDKASASIGNAYTGEDYVSVNDDGIWGGTSRELLSTGIKIHPASLKEIEAGFLKGSAYTMEKVTKSSWFGLKNKESISERYDGEVDSKVMDSIAESYVRGVEVMKTAAEALGMSADEFDAVSAQWEIALSQLNFEGMDAQQRSEAIMGVISSDLDRWGETLGQVSLYIEQYKTAGEGSAETLVRLANDFEVVERSFRDMGLVLPTVAAGGLAVSESLIQAAGGMQNYASAMSMFMNTFYTDEERLAMSMKNLEISFAAVGLTVPSTREAMKVMVEKLQLDLSLAKQSLAVAQHEYEAKTALLQATIANAGVASQAAAIAAAGAQTAANQAAQAAALVEKLEGQIASVMTNMSSITEIFGDASFEVEDLGSSMGDMGGAASSAAEAIEIVYASLMDIAGLKAQWVEDLPGAQMILDATREDTGLSELTFDNFLAKFTEASSGGTMTSEEFGDWSSMSSALRSYNDIVERLEKERLEEEKKKLEAEKKALNEQLKFYEDIIKRIDDAYGGKLSYLNSIEKAEYFSDRAKIDIENGDSKSYFNNLSNQLDYEKKMSVTKEAYIPLFEKYIEDLKKAEPEKTMDDAVESLDDINHKLDEVMDTIEKASYQ